MGSKMANRKNLNNKSYSWFIWNVVWKRVLQIPQTAKTQISLEAKVTKSEATYFAHVMRSQC